MRDFYYSTQNAPRHPPHSARHEEKADPSNLSSEMEVLGILAGLGLTGYVVYNIGKVF